jgi:hypothetical protein
MPISFPVGGRGFTGTLSQEKQANQYPVVDLLIVTVLMLP